MRIGILSDIHDNIWALERALNQLSGCDALFCLGDLCSPFTMLMLGQGFAGPVHVVWGNNDGDKLLLTRQAERAGNVTLHGEIGELELEDRKIAICHYGQVADPLARCGAYDLVCYGHSHRREEKRYGNCLLVNPGEVMGRFGESSCAVYDSGKHEISILVF